ncbi:MAG: hypothetical protein A2231_11030, partial [Candidatus Firestonebacteria bacterium RIFOXYA2_FULL_40_8]
VCAAIAAARSGVKTALIQDRPVLGGNASSEIRVCMHGAGAHNPGARETGIMEEITLEEKMQSHETFSQVTGNAIKDIILFEKVKNEKNLTLFLNTSVFEVMKKKTIITGIKCFQLGTEKTFTFYGKIFIDCTGDGTVGAKAGAIYRYGREARAEFNECLAPVKADKQTMGTSLMFKSVKLDKFVKYIPPSFAEIYPTEQSLYKRHHLKEEGFWWIEIGGKNFNIIEDNEKIRDLLLKHLTGVWDHIKNRCEHKEFSKNLALDWVGMVPAKRESRRLIGDHILNYNEEINRELFNDRVAYSGWFADVHTMGGILAKNKPPESLHGDDSFWDKVNMKPFSIPFRSLYSKNIDNLFFAGRNISTSHVGMGSTRVMKTCAVMGEAVGTASSLCIKGKMTPRDIFKGKIKELQQMLLKNDCFLLNLKNEDKNDLALGAKVKASSSSPLKFPEGKKPWGLKGNVAQLFPVSGNKIDSVKWLLESKLKKATTVTLRLRKAIDLWDFSSTKDLVVVKATVKPGKKHWVEFKLDKYVEANRLYLVMLDEKKGVSAFYGNTCPPGTQAAWKRLNWSKWHFFYAEDAAFSIKVTPEVSPYSPQNITNGVARAERWTNIWISDPAKKLPQYAEIDLGGKKNFNTLHLAFDTNLSLAHNGIPALYKHPEAVKDYEILVFTGNKWKKLAKVEGNYHRRRVHTFKTVESSKVRINVLATNGDKSARVYEVRVYDEKMLHVAR